MNTENIDFDIEFVFLDVSEFPFPEQYTREWILGLIKQEGKTPGMLNFIFCTDAYLIEINKRFLKHDEFTDIVTFDYSEDFDNISGDIYISIDRVKENAKRFEASFDIELHRVLAHGVLHIVGFKDKELNEKKIMTQKENQYLELIDFL